MEQSAFMPLDVYDIQATKLHLLSLCTISNRAQVFLNTFFNYITMDASTIFSMNEIYTFQQWEYNIQNPTQSPICSKNVKQKTVFRCYDCMQYDTSILCYDCFINSNHKGHSYRQMISEGGCCDCGDSQVWSQNGFCSKHTNKEQKISLSPEIKDTFLIEMKIVTYIYFWLNQKGKYQYLIKLYGKYLLKSIKKLVLKDYQSKYLIFNLLSSDLDIYENSQKKKVSILESFFHLNINFHEQHQLFIEICFQLYPVEQFRSFFIKEYFNYSQQKIFLDSHPFISFSYQYLYCIKYICKMIKQQELKPLAINAKVYQNQSDQVIISSVKRYYEDLIKMSKIKKVHQYHSYHFSMTNIADMAFYRKFSLLEDSRFIEVDQYFVKILGNFVCSIRLNKPLLAKSLRQLFHFIINFDKMTLSLAQERAFAMIMIAFIDGSLNKLNEDIYLQQVQKLLQIDSLSGFKQNPSQFYTQLIKKGLKNKIKLYEYNIQHNNNGYEQYYYGHYPQTNMIQCLDSLYHKILYALSKKYVSYNKIFTQLILQQQAQQPITINRLVDFIMNMNLTYLDQLVITNYLGFEQNKQEIIQFYGRLLSTFNSRFNIQDFTMLAESVLHNKLYLKQFLKNKIINYGNKIKLKQQMPALQKLSFGILQNWQEYDNFSVINKAVNYQLIETFFGQQLFDQNIIKLIINNFKKTVQNDVLPKDQRQFNVSKAVLLLVKIYLITKDSNIYKTLNQSLQNISKIVNEQIIDALYFLLKDKQQLQNMKDKKIHDKEQNDKKRRQKIDAKKRQKQIIMKKNQQDLLKKYHVQQESSSQNDLCIYCKQDIKDQGELVSYVNITNLISSKILKSTDYHLFFRTCGHKVHKQCYNKHYLSVNKSLSCFLCKKQTNLVIPELSKRLDLGKAQQQILAIDIIDRIYMALLTQQSQNDKLTQCILNQNLPVKLITSFCKEIIYSGLHHEGDFMKNHFQIYKEIYHLLSFVSEDMLLKCFQTLDDHPLIYTQAKQLQEAEFIAYNFLKKKLKLQKTQTSQSNQSHFRQVIQQFIVSLIEDKPIKKINLNLINVNQILIKIPQNIQLLHNWMGQCPLCKIYTNWLLTCLFCGQKACLKEGKFIHQHQKQKHYEGTIYINSANGRLTFVCSKGIRQWESIYSDEFLQFYTHHEQNLIQKQIVQSFKLNQSKVQQLFKLIINHEICEQIK